MLNKKTIERIRKLDSKKNPKDNNGLGPNEDSLYNNEL